MFHEPIHPSLGCRRSKVEKKRRAVHSIHKSFRLVLKLGRNYSLPNRKASKRFSLLGSKCWPSPFPDCPHNQSVLFARSSNLRLKNINHQLSSTAPLAQDPFCVPYWCNPSLFLLVADIFESLSFFQFYIYSGDGLVLLENHVPRPSIRAAKAIPDGGKLPVIIIEFLVVDAMASGAVYDGAVGDIFTIVCVTRISMIQG